MIYLCLAFLPLCIDESGTVAMYDDGTGGGGGGYGASWEQYYDENGYPYWYDTASGATQYETPEGY